MNAVTLFSERRIQLRAIKKLLLRSCYAKFNICQFKERINVQIRKMQGTLLTGYFVSVFNGNLNP